MASEKILVISEGKSLILHALQRNLTKNGYELVHCPLDVEALHEHERDAELILMYLNGDEDSKTEALIYLKDLCTEKNKLLILLGNPADIKSVERPVNTEALLERLAYLTDVNATQDRLKHILIVDDDETFLKTVKNWLSRQYRVTIVTSGAQAMMYVADNQPDLILLDYEMPVTSGPQVLEMLRSEPKTAKIPVIFLTGKGDRDSVFQVLALKPEGYILKSSGRDKLVESVGSFFMKQLYDKLHD